MSMISAQCDELRQMAESVGLAMPQAATLMMGAADTIWELRCKCAGMVDMRERARLAEAENANLRERITTQKQTIQAYRDESREWREVADHVQAENAKLRELVRDMWLQLLNAYDCKEVDEFADRMRELGAEVDA